MGALRQHRKERRRKSLEVISQWLLLKEDGTIKNRGTGQNFNPLRRIPITEPTHSRLIGDFLKNNGEHGQGNKFLIAFLDLIGVPCAGEGTWQVTVERGNVDICLTRTAPPSVVIIENKSNWAVDQRSQLYRYWNSHVHTKYPSLDYKAKATRDSFKLIYLVPHVGKRLEIQSRCRPHELDAVPYVEVPLEIVIVVLKDLFASWGEVEIPPDNHRLKTFLAFYAELWENSGHDE